MLMGASHNAPAKLVAIRKVLAFVFPQLAISDLPSNTGKAQSQATTGIAANTTAAIGRALFIPLSSSTTLRFAKQHMAKKQENGGSEWYTIVHNPNPFSA